MPIYGASADQLLLLVIAVAIDAYVGGALRGRDFAWHPAAVIARLIDWLARKLNRPQRSATDRRVRGVLTAVVVVGAAIATGATLGIVSAAAPLLWLAELLVLIALIDVRGALIATRALGEAFEEGGLETAKAALPALGSRDPARVDQYEAMRLGVECLAGRLATDVVAPIFFYAAFGPAGLLGARAAFLLDERLGIRAPEAAAFGAGAKRVARLFAWPASVLAAAAAIAGAAMLNGAEPLKAVRAMAGAAPLGAKLPADTMGRELRWVTAAFAGALDFALIGPRRYAAGTVNTPWIGTGRARLEVLDLYRARQLYVTACAASVAIPTAIVVVGWLT